MKLRRKQEVDSAENFLKQLAADRESILTEDEYQSVRNWQLQVLAKPLRIEWAIAGPGLACILIGVGLLVTAALTRITTSEDTTMNRSMIGLLLVGLGSYFFFGDLCACRATTRRTSSERLAEIDDLLRSGLITEKEHAMIKQTIKTENAVKVQNALT